MREGEVVVITTWETDSKGKKVLMVSHGVDVNDRVVILPTCHPADLGAVFDQQRQEWVLPGTKDVPRPKKPVVVFRNAGHPWDGRPGFDHLDISVPEDQKDLFDRLSKEALSKHWHAWISGKEENSGNLGALFYKPCGIESDWNDSPEKPHPGNPPK